MACGCRKNGNSVNRGAAVRPRAANITNQPTQVQAQAQSPSTPLNAAGLSAERRRVQAVRREAIRRALNK